MSNSAKRAIRPPTPGKPGGMVVEAEIPATAVGGDNTDPSRQPPIKKQRADFREHELLRVIEQHGLTVTWRKAMVCVCFDVEMGREDMSCALCNGSGFFYVDPIEIQALFTGGRGARYRTGDEKQGAVQTMDRNVTVRPNHRIGHWDSLTMHDSVTQFAEAITKGNRRGVKRKLPDGVDSCRYRVADIEAMMYRETATSPLMALQRNVHYQITDEGWIEWKGQGRAIPEGALITVRYLFHPVWIITDHPYASRDVTTALKRAGSTTASLPIQARAVLDFLLDEQRGPGSNAPPLPVEGD